MRFFRSRRFQFFMIIISLMFLISVIFFYKESKAIVFTTAAYVTGYTLTSSLAVADAAFTAGAYICWQHSNDRFWQSLDAQDSSGDVYSRSDIKDAIVEHNDLQYPEPSPPDTLNTKDELKNNVLYDGSDYYVPNYTGSGTCSANCGMYYEGWWRTDAYCDVQYYYDVFDGDSGNYSYLCYNTQSSYDGNMNIADLDSESLESKYPEYFSTNNIIPSAKDALGDDLQVGGKDLDSAPDDAYNEFPNGMSNTKEIDVAGVHTGTNNSAGYIITPTGERISVSKGTAEDIQQETDAPSIDTNSVGDDVIDDADESTGPAPIPSNLNDKLNNAGVNGDITGISGNTISWIDSDGDEHITSVSNSLADSVADVVPDSIASNWEATGSGSASSALESTKVEVEGDMPEPLSQWSGSFDSSVDAPEKKDIPVDSWKDSIPFLGALQNTQVTYTNSDPLMNFNFQIASKSYSNTVDFSRWSGILGAMGQALVAVASFFALRFALIS